MVETGSTTSRRALLGTLAVAPIAAASCWHVPLNPPSGAATDEPPSLRRTKEGRSLSRTRYHNAEGFFAGVEARSRLAFGDQLYRVGIATQLGLSSHLLDVGFDDAWCASHIGLNLVISLACANATGLGHSSAAFERLATFLSPYGKWRDADLSGLPGDCPFSGAQACQLTRALLDRVREVTGHPRPHGWRQRAL